MMLRIGRVHRNETVYVLVGHEIIRGNSLFGMRSSGEIRCLTTRFGGTIRTQGVALCTNPSTTPAGVVQARIPPYPRDMLPRYYLIRVAHAPSPLTRWVTGFHAKSPSVKTTVRGFYTSLDSVLTTFR